MKSLYYEDVDIGEKFRTVGRTIDQTDITLFAMLSGDFNQVHTNAEYCKKTPFGKRIAHGILTLAITSGLLMRLGLFEETGLAHLGSAEKYLAPVFPGDTIYAEIEVVGKKPMGQQRGMITVRIDTKNQEDKIVLTQEMNFMVRCRE